MAHSLQHTISTAMYINNIYHHINVLHRTTRRAGHPIRILITKRRNFDIFGNKALSSCWSQHSKDPARGTGGCPRLSANNRQQETWQLFSTGMVDNSANSKNYCYVLHDRLQI